MILMATCRACEGGIANPRSRGMFTHNSSTGYFGTGARKSIFPSNVVVAQPSATFVLSPPSTDAWSVQQLTVVSGPVVIIILLLFGRGGVGGRGRGRSSCIILVRLLWFLFVLLMPFSLRLRLRVRLVHRGGVVVGDPFSALARSRVKHGAKKCSEGVH